MIFKEKVCSNHLNFNKYLSWPIILIYPLWHFLAVFCIPGIVDYFYVRIFVSLIFIVFTFMTMVESINPKIVKTVLFFGIFSLFFNTFLVSYINAVYCVNLIELILVIVFLSLLIEERKIFIFIFSFLAVSTLFFLSTPLHEPMVMIYSSLFVLFSFYFFKYVPGLADIRTNEGMIETAYSISKIGWWNYNVSKNHFYWGDNTYEIFEIEKNQKMNLEMFSSFFIEDCKQNFKEAIHFCVNNNQAFCLEFRLISKKGNKKRVKISGAGKGPLDTSRAKEIFGTIEDVTEEKMKQFDVINHSRMLALGEMASGIAHEMSTPVMGIRGHAEILMKFINNEKYDKETFIKYLSRAMDGCDKMATLANALRDFSHERVHYPMEEFVLNDIIQNSLEFFEVKLKEKQIEVKFDDSVRYKIKARPTELLHAFHNLFNNSIDAIDGKVEKQSEWIEIKIVDKESDLEIYFIDSGLGVPKEIEDRLMHPFCTTKALNKGMGIGLNLSKEILKGMNGKLVYDNSQEHTTFKLVIPKNEG